MPGMYLIFSKSHPFVTVSGRLFLQPTAIMSSFSFPLLFRNGLISNTDGVKL